MDYARFSQMLLNGGQLDRVRLLGRATVAQMSSDHVGDYPGRAPTLGRGYGFGLGFAVRKETGLNWVTGSAGEYRWGGAGGTALLGGPEGADGGGVDEPGRSPARGAERTATCSASSSRPRSSTEAAGYTVGPSSNTRPESDRRGRLELVAKRRHRRAERDEAVDDGRGHAGGVTERTWTSRRHVGDVLASRRRRPLYGPVGAK